MATFRSGALPVIAALGGIILPALIYASIAPPELRHGWGIPIGTDTAFAVAMIVFLGSRVPVELRVFLTAAVIIDDIVAILVIALFYTGQIYTSYLIASGAVTAFLVVLNRTGVYGTLPYAVCGVVLWFFLHEAGLHATLAGVILAVLIPTRPPANLNVLLAQAATVIHLEDSHSGEAMRPGPSEPAFARWTPSTPGSSRPLTNFFGPSSRGRAMLCYRSSHWPTRASSGRPVYSKDRDD